MTEVRVSIATHNTHHGVSSFPRLAHIVGRQEMEGTEHRRDYLAMVNREHFMPRQDLKFGPACVPLDWDPQQFSILSKGYRFSRRGLRGQFVSSYLTWVIGRIVGYEDLIAILNLHFVSQAWREEYGASPVGNQALRRSHWFTDRETLTLKANELKTKGYLVFTTLDLNRKTYGHLPGFKELRLNPTPFDRIAYMPDARVKHALARFGSYHGSDHRAIIADLVLNLTPKEEQVATPMTPAQWRSQLKKWNVPFREHGDFAQATSGRDDETGLIFGPVYGIVNHHTGSDGADANNRLLINQGRPDLPGPLAQAGLNDDGVIDMFTWKRANHAGGGDPDVLRAVRNESYGDFPPPTDKHQGEAGAVDGNDALYGLEIYYSGSHPPSAKAYRSAVLWNAAICDFHGWSAKSCIGHKEWSDWKWDPGNVNMKTFRADVQQALNNGPSNPPTPAPLKPTPNITKAIAENIEYDRALDEVKLPAAQDEVTAYRAALKTQRLKLREMERR